MATSAPALPSWVPSAWCVSVPSRAVHGKLAACFLPWRSDLQPVWGYIGYAVLFLLLVGAATLLLYCTPFAQPKATDRELRITIPESLDYEGIFDDLFSKYTDHSELIRVRTTNMGSLYELCYHVRLKECGISKAFLDDIRCRNGNLNVVCGRISHNNEQL